MGTQQPDKKHFAISSRDFYLEMNSLLSPRLAVAICFATDGERGMSRRAQLGGHRSQILAVPHTKTQITKWHKWTATDPE